MQSLARERDIRTLRNWKIILGSGGPMILSRSRAVKNWHGKSHLLLGGINEGDFEKITHYGLSKPCRGRRMLSPEYPPEAFIARCSGRFSRKIK